MDQSKFVTAVRQTPAVDPVYQHSWVSIRKGGGISYQHHKMAWRDEASDRKSIMDAVGKTQATQLEIGARYIL